MDKDISVLSEETIKNKIFIIRGQRVMLDSDLAKIYGYTTKAFNQQVKNNIEKFEEDFRFQLTKEETSLISRSKNLTLNNEDKRGSNIKYLPYAFTEQGIYMLMTVLKGDLATRQSKTIIRLFKQMKDYLINNTSLIGYDELIKLTMQTAAQTTANTLQLQKIKEELVTKNDLTEFMKNFVDKHLGKELLFLDGEIVEADIAYSQIYGYAQKTIYIIDNYIGLKTLLLLKNISNNVKVIIFTDNVGKSLTKKEYEDFIKEYGNIKITFQKTCGQFHDRFIILDYSLATEKIFHCGCSSKDAGLRTTAITKSSCKTLYKPMIQTLLNNPTLILK